VAEFDEDRFERTVIEFCDLEVPPSEDDIQVIESIDTVVKNTGNSLSTAELLTDINPHACC